MAGASKVKTGSFNGNNTVTKILDIGFEPDVVVISTSDIDYSASGSGGLISVVCVKGVVMTNVFHNPSTTAQPWSPCANPVNENDDPWGADKESYTGSSYPTYCRYSNGSLTVTNGQNAGRVYFVSGKTYTWTAFKY